jgi:lipid-binding SYLF domain-containing protein
MKYRLMGIATITATMFAAEPSTNERLQNATEAFHEIMASPDQGIPKDLLAKSQCIVIVPNLLKAAFIFGAKYGRGFASCRHGPGWSSPAAVRIEGGSFGFQLGGSSTDLFMLVMNKHGMQGLLTDKFTIGGDAAGAAGPVGRSTSAQTDAMMKAEILTWSRSRGLFAGISLEGATLRPDSSENRKVYGHDISNREILETGVPTPPGARVFVAMLNRESRFKEGAPAEALGRPGGRMRLGEKQINFATAQATIPGEAEPALSQVAQTLKDNPAWRVRIEGFTDNVGRPDTNAKLSEQRAEAVKTWLVGHGIDAARLATKGYGAARPIANNSTDEGRAQNRRVEIVRVGIAAPTGE